MISSTDLDLAEAKHSSERRFLFVGIGSDTFGIPIDSVKEVIEYTTTTMIPMCSNIINGVINVRGSVVPVLDVMHRLQLKAESVYDKYSCIVLYEFEDADLEEVMIIGLIVRNVLSIEAIDESNLEAAPTFGSNIPNQFIWRITQVNGHLCNLLNMENLLNINEINNKLKQQQESYFNVFSEQ